MVYGYIIINVMVHDWCNGSFNGWFDGWWLM